MSYGGLAARRRGPSWAESGRAALLPYLGARAVVLGALLLARFLVDSLHPTGEAGARAAGTVHSGLLAWDASWYRRIAEVGYAPLGHPALRFFPLFPLAGRYLGEIPGLGAGRALVLLANVFSFVALVLLHRLVSREQVVAGTAGRSLWVLSLWPAAFVLVMGYSEALLLCLSLLAFYAWRTGRPGWAVLPAYLAGLCRPVGVLLAVPALVEAVLAWRAGRRRRGDLFSRGLSVLAAPAGAATFMGWSAARFNNFLLPLSEQVSRRHRGGVADPLVTVWRDAGDLFAGHHLGTALHAPFVVAFVALTVYLFFRLPAAYGWYAAVTMAVAVTAPNLDSFERYGLACFPLAVAVGCLTENRLAERLVLAGLGAVLLACALLAFLGLYVP